jgi:hypothetical protein
MSKTLEELEYEKTYQDECVLEYHNIELESVITFRKIGKSVSCKDEYNGYQNISMEELKAIYKYCEDLGWI